MDPFRSFPSFNSSFSAAAATYLYTSPKQGEVTPFSFLSFFLLLRITEAHTKIYACCPTPEESFGVLKRPGFL